MEPTTLNNSKPVEASLDDVLLLTSQKTDETNQLLEHIIEQNEKNNPETVLESSLVVQKQILDKVSGPDSIEIEVKGASVATIVGPKGDQGPEGKEGKTPVKGVDYFTKKEVDEIVKKVQSQIPKPKDGKTPQRGVDYFTDEDIADFIKTVVPFFPRGRDGKDAVVNYDAIVAAVIEGIPKPKDGKDGKDAVVDYDVITKKLKGKISYEDLKDKPTIFKSGSKTVSLTELDDVDVSGLTQTNGKYVLGSGGGGNPAGSNGQIQFNNNDEFDADANFTFDTVNKNLVVGGDNTNKGAVVLKPADTANNWVFLHNIDTGSNEGIEIARGAYPTVTQSMLKVTGTGSMTTGGSATISGPLSVSGSSAFSSTSSGMQIGGSTSSWFGSGVSTSSPATLSSGVAYSRSLIGKATVTTAASGTHPQISSLAIRPQTITSGGSTITNTATLYVEDAMTGGSNNYAIWSDAGVNRFDGIFNVGGTDVPSNRVWGANNAGTAMEAKTITGTTNQVIVTHGTGSITFGTPQNIGTSSSPQFASIELGAATDTTISRVSAGVIAVEGIAVPTISSTNTLTNKRITQRVSTITSSTTPTPNADTDDLYTVTALAAGATFAAPTGTPTEGQKLTIRIKDNGSAKTLNWNAIYRAIGVSLPTTTVISKTMYLGFIYNSTDTKWDLVAKSEEV